MEHSVEHIPLSPHASATTLEHIVNLSNIIHDFSCGNKWTDLTKSDRGNKVLSECEQMDYDK